jgi:uncharacterized protein YjiS (DUF1127 family)
MEHTMASKPIIYEPNSGAPTPRGSATIARGLLVFASALPAWFGAVAARCGRAVAEEVRIRRDTRQLMLMSDEMLKDIGLSRAQIDRAVRYGRER